MGILNTWYIIHVVTHHYLTRDMPAAPKQQRAGRRRRFTTYISCNQHLYLMKMYQPTSSSSTHHSICITIINYCLLSQQFHCIGTVAAAAAVRRVETRPIEDVVEWQLQVAIVYQGCPSIDSNCHRLPSSTARSTMDLIIRDAYVIQYGAPSITYGYYIQNVITINQTSPG